MTIIIAEKPSTRPQETVSAHIQARNGRFAPANNTSKDKHRPQNAYRSKCQRNMRPKVHKNCHRNRRFAPQPWSRGTLQCGTPFTEKAPPGGAPCTRHTLDVAIEYIGRCPHCTRASRFMTSEESTVSTHPQYIHTTVSYLVDLLVQEAPQ